MAGDDQLFPEPQATETLKCTLCGDIFEHQRLLKFHMNNHHGQHYQISVRDIPSHADIPTCYMPKQRLFIDLDGVVRRGGT